MRESYVITPVGARFRLVITNSCYKNDSWTFATAEEAELKRLEAQALGQKYLAMERELANRKPDSGTWLITHGE